MRPAEENVFGLWVRRIEVSPDSLSPLQSRAGVLACSVEKRAQPPCDRKASLKRS